MFTGIITGIGLIVAIESLGDSIVHGKRVFVTCPLDYLADVNLGDSIALNGACMTVTSLDQTKHTFSFDISIESLNKTTGLSCEGSVNLEKALRANDRLGGHLVSGHVDCTGHITEFESTGESWYLEVLVPNIFSKYMAYKGSITINGVSLTVNEVKDTINGCEINMNLIPHTVSQTTLGSLKKGSVVNIEIDQVARYIERLISKKAQFST